MPPSSAFSALRFIRLSSPARSAACRISLALICFVALMAWKAPPWVVVLLAAVGGAALSLMM
jgi:hypothetical protein